MHLGIPLATPPPTKSMTERSYLLLYQSDNGSYRNGLTYNKKWQMLKAIFLPTLQHQHISHTNWLSLPALASEQNIFIIRGHICNIMLVLVGLKCNKVLPVIQTEEAANNCRKMVTPKSRKSALEKVWF
jgi:hypothetical protein